MSSHGGCRVRAVTVLFVLLFGCLVLCTQCRSALPKDGVEAKSHPSNSHLATTCPSSSGPSNHSASPLDESKLKLVLCFYKGLRCVEGEPCYCCVLEQPEPHCYCTHDECESKCPFCFPPPCSRPGAAVEEGRALQAGTNATTL